MTEIVSTYASSPEGIEKAAFAIMKEIQGHAKKHQQKLKKGTQEEKSALYEESIKPLQ